jgi:hypothetical protein
MRGEGETANCLQRRRKWATEGLRRGYRVYVNGREREKERRKKTKGGIMCEEEGRKGEV